MKGGKVLSDQLCGTLVMEGAQWYENPMTLSTDWMGY